MARIMVKRNIVSKAAGAVAAVFCIALLADTAPVFAGFEWKSPLSAPADSSAPVSMPDGGIQWENLPALPVQKVEESETAKPGKMPFAQSRADIVSGFGSDLPLVTALQQVLPAGYTFSFSPGINPATRVSWEGDKAWQQVIDDMLAPKGLGFTLRDKVVVVSRLTGTEPANRPSAMSDVMQEPLADSAPPPSMKKVDMIPDDMIWDSKPADSWTPPAPVAEKPATVTIHRERPTPPSTGGFSMRASQKPAPDLTFEEQTAMIQPVKEPAYAEPPRLSSSSLSFSKVQQPVWHVTKGQTLKEVLTEWSKAANVEVYWTIDYDYRLNDDTTYNGSYETAVGKLFDLFTKTRPQPYGKLHRGEADDKVLVVGSYDLSN